MKRLIFILVFIITTSIGFAQKSAYLLYNTKGKTTNYSKLLKDAMNADIVLFGELHNNPVCHWLQLELAKDLYSGVGDRLILGAEMFESDNAMLVNEYISNKIKTRNFEAEAKLWPNYKTDYKPLIEFARENGLSFIASNIPRRYAAMVNSGGFEALETLSDKAKELIAPLPVEFDPELSQYKKMASMMGGQMGDHISNNTVKAQAIKDATMAHFILDNFKPGMVFLHFHGSFHSDFFEGIMWYLQQQNKDLKIVTLSSVELDDVDDFPEEKKGAADYILAIPSTMTKTH